MANTKSTALSGGMIQSNVVIVSCQDGMLPDLVTETNRKPLITNLAAKGDG